MLLAKFATWKGQCGANYRISGYFQGLCIFHEWALIFHFKNFNFTNGYCGPYLSNAYEVFQDFIFHELRLYQLKYCH